MADYRESPLATRPKTLDPNEYFNLSPEYRRAEESRAALRSNLKRQYLLQLNNPHRKQLIDDPALTRWVHARANPYPYFRPTFKTSLMGFTFGILPFVGLCFLLKTGKERKDKRIQEGLVDRRFHLTQ
ncbi:NADH dehydrogenase [ubiquinone] 1 beta subcomplex subunit 4 [Neosynchiropus ocellatus]